MIAYLEGRLEYVSDPAIVVVTDGGVGYEVEVTARCRQGLPEKGQRVRLYTSLLVREDLLRLCGFETMEERLTFEILITVPKVGPRLGLAILSVYRPADLRRIIADADVTALTAVSGIGKRLAENIYRELSYKLKMEMNPEAGGLEPGSGRATVYHSVLDGLKGLGYSEGECSAIVQELLREQPDLDVPSALRGALQMLGRGK